MSPDPIGIAGGDCNRRYAENPNMYVDPFGLVNCTCCKHGTFAGEVGNSAFTPNDPAKFGLEPGQSIPFNNGIPDFGQFTQSVLGLPGEFSVPGLTGNASGDRSKIIKHMAEQAGVTQQQVKDIVGRSGQDLRLHHVGGDRVQVVPAKTHALPHQGGTMELREACK